MGIRRKGRLGICVLVRASAVLVSKTCQRPESMLLCRSGLFRPLRSPAYEGTLVCSGGSSKTEDQEEKYLVCVPLVMKQASTWFLVFA